MKIVTLTTALLVSLMLSQVNEMPGNHYCNARFGYCIEYPNFLTPQPESENGDGRVFKNKQGEVILTVYGTINLDAMTLEKQYKTDIASKIAGKDSIEYKKLGKQFYVISGHSKGKIFYQKTITKDDSFCFAILEYKESEKALYDSVSTSIFKSFK